MIHDVRINFKLRLSDPLSKHPALVDYESAYKQLTSIIAELNVASEKYCLVLKVIKGPFLIDDNKTSPKLESLTERLSKRELQIFELAMEGLTNKQISEKLFISLETVRSHRKKIVSKAGVGKIEEIKNWVLREKF